MRPDFSWYCVQASRAAAQLEGLRAGLAPARALAAVRERQRALHSPAQRLLFHEFCEALVRVTALALPAGGDLASHVGSFLADHIATADVKVCKTTSVKVDIRVSRQFRVRQLCEGAVV